MNLKLIACEIFYRELCMLVAQSPNKVDVEFIPKGLHDLETSSMLEYLQGTIDRVEEGEYEAVALAYGLCNNGVVGLCARSLPLVLPRAHDCITLFLGSRERYRDYFTKNPGTYFLTSGWIERRDARGELKEQSIQHRTGMDLSFQELVEKYGEDNARYLHERLGDTTANYRQFTYIDMGIDPAGRFERQARAAAEERGWDFHTIPGDLSLLRGLVDGPWDGNEYLVLQPGSCIKAAYGADIVTGHPCQCDGACE